jgi:hypothetical protein
MQILRLAVLFSLVTVASSAVAKADCPPWRPCGAGNTWGGNRLVPQGFYGADFRPACARHDECLLSCTCRRDCDRQFLCDMNCACECSRHPRLCRAKARCYYAMARLLGGLYH